MSQRDFWQKRSMEWEESVYEGVGGGSLLERLATHFRGNLRVRFGMACELLQEARPGCLLEIGCGQGRLVRLAVEQGWAARGIGVDISAPAIESARKLAREAGLSKEKLAFHVSAVGEMSPELLQEADWVMGYGLLQYLTDREYDFLFSRLRGKNFAFDWHDKRWNRLNAMHAVYRLFRRHPFYHRFSERKIVELLAKHGFAPSEIRRNDIFRICVVRRAG